tara:strand:- start:820 stop:969 length:150 start_codon:yes stop_codon:yes gene_type:complete
MFKAIIKMLMKFPKSNADYEEEYLAKSVDHYDLERRQKELLRKQFSYWI